LGGVTLTLDAVSYRYAGARTAALHDISLKLAEGEVVGLAGASESGKTTLCLVASGLAPRAVGGAIRGRILLDGADVADWPMHRLSERIAICFQSPATQLSQVAGTVFEEVAFGPMNLGVPRDVLVERTWDAVETLRIASLVERDPLRLSGGQQQLVAMAGLLAMAPQHLVLDEPTAQLDPAGTRLVADALARLAERGSSILVAEQKTDLLASVATRVVVLDAGRLALEGPADVVLADPAIEAVGVGVPAAVRLRRRALQAGLDPGRLDPAIIGALHPGSRPAS
jgi:energy-coupling factor transport system ATP-binding protein